MHLFPRTFLRMFPCMFPYAFLYVFRYALPYSVAVICAAALCLGPSVSEAAPEAAPDAAPDAALRDPRAGLAMGSLNGLAAAAVSAPDQAPAQAPAMRLADVIAIALEYSPALRRRDAVIDEHQALLKVRAAGYWPTLDGTVGANRSHRSVRHRHNSHANQAQHASAASAALALDWVLYDSGLRDARFDSASSLVRAALAGREDSVRAVIIAATEAFYKAQFARAAGEAAAEAERVAGVSARSAAALLAAGTGSISDKLLAQTSCAQARLRRIETQSGHRTALADLAGIMGLPRATQLEVTLEALRQEDPFFAENAAALVRQALDIHPRVRAAAAQVRAAAADRAAARADGLPRLSLAASTQQGLAAAQSSAGGQRSSGWSVGLQLKIPLFDGHARLYSERAVASRLAARQADLADVRQEVEKEIWNNHESLRAQTERLDAATALRDTAAQALKAAQARYRAGVGRILDLLRAQSEMADGTRQYLQAQADRQAAKIRLAVSIGQLETLSLLP